MAVDGGGALFVIRGDLSKIDADGCLISSDHRLKVGKRWSEVIRSERTAGSDQPPRSGVAPDDLRVTFDESAGARPGDRRKALILVTNVAINSAGGPQQAVRGMRAALEEAQERWNQEPPETLRARPLLAMPVVGVGRGGMAHKRGAVIKEVLEKLSDRLPDLCFDVVLVCRRGSDNAAVQHVRRASGLPGNSGPVGEQGTHTDRVAEHARARSLSLLFGAGAGAGVSVSVSLGLPLWSQMLKDLATSASEPLDGLDGLDAMDAASLLFRDADAEKIREALKTMVTVNRLSLTHGLMGSLRPTVAVTTNYYRGYEIAMKGAYGVTPTVLPWSEPAQPGQPRLLKLHGDVGKKSIVLTREESVEMHAVRRPLTGLLQEQLLSGHVLVLGTSMSDATLAQAVSEARALREHVKNSRGTSETPGWVTQRMGTFVMHSSHPARQALFGTELLRRGGGRRDGSKRGCRRQGPQRRPLPGPGRDDGQR